MAVENIYGPDAGPVDISINVGEEMVSRGISPEGLSIAAREKIWEILDRIAFQVGEFVDEVWPVDTGASQADWEVTAEGFYLVIRNPREYAGYVRRKKQTGLVYKEIGREAERLLSAAWPEIKKAAKASEAERTDPSDRPAFVRQFLLPSTATQGEAARGALFLSRVAGFLRQNTRSRERARARTR